MNPTNKKFIEIEEQLKLYPSREYSIDITDQVKADVFGVTEVDCKAISGGGWEMVAFLNYQSPNDFSDREFKKKVYEYSNQFGFNVYISENPDERKMTFRKK